jgi:hypothetical protein
MESQILYESLTKPRNDLDKNMNKTLETTESTVTLEENHVTPVNNTSARGQCTQNGETGVSQFKSKLQEQLETPLLKSFTSSITANLSYQDVPPQFGVTSSAIESALLKKSETTGSNQTETESSAFSPQVQTSDLVSTSDIKSESSSLHSPGASSNRSFTTSPQPSPASTVTSPQEVTSSRSLSNSFKMREKRRRRGSAWTDDETEYLMEVWAKQAELNKQKGGEESVTCAPVYRLISRSMAELGWEKTWEQCKTRIHTLKRAYKITKDEIAEGCQTITYCRHFDKLEIICCDNPQISPGMLAANLEQKRKQRGTQFKGKKQPVRRKLTVGQNPNLVKKANTFNSLPSISSISQFNGQSSSLSQEVPVSATVSTSSSTVWYPPLPSQQQQQQLQQQHSQTPANFNQSNHFTQQPLQASGLQTASPYPYNMTPSANINSFQPLSYTNVAEVNNNDIVVKNEKTDAVVTDDNAAKHYEQQNKQWSVPFSKPPAVQTTSSSKAPSTGNDLERMRLDLELRKLEVERNKIEMEERQRREDRDHQYRMMQLLLFGLGQQNIPQLLSGQGPDVTHAHSTDLSRALESGLVPGSQKANEKGLSFSEL